MPAAAQGLQIVPEVDCILTENYWCVESATIDWQVPTEATDVEGCVTLTINSFTAGTVLSCEYIAYSAHHSGMVTIKVITVDQLESEVIDLHGQDVYNHGQENSIRAKLDTSRARYAAADYMGAAGPLEAFYNQVIAITPEESVTPCFILALEMAGALRLVN